MDKDRDLLDELERSDRSKAGPKPKDDGSRKGEIPDEE